MKKKLIKENKPGLNGVVHSIAIDGMYENWFLDYASYVILERAVPRIEDGFKPVQRRISYPRIDQTFRIEISPFPNQSGWTIRMVGLQLQAFQP